LEAPAPFNVRRLGALSALGWCVTIRSDTPRPEALLGRMVETSADGFFEGVWDGPFGEFGFVGAKTVMGSGAQIADGTVHFCSPTHALDYLYSVRVDDALLVANSLPLLLACAEDAPDHRYRYYRAKLTEFWRSGVLGTPLSLPTVRGRSVAVYAAANLTVDRDLHVHIGVKPQADAPHDFASYRQMLATTLGGLVENGTDRGRRLPLDPLATLSSGYDSAASTVLGAEAGITDAVTVTQEKSVDDSGAGIAATLGLHVTVVDRNAWKQSTIELELECMASVGGPTALPITAVADLRPAPMVLLGTLGDHLWETPHALMQDGQSIPDGLSLSSLGMHDFRLRAGVTFVHVPAIGAAHADAIARISRSDEMKPWSIRHAYNRPIPRRIVEDAGIPRSAFAVKKHGGAAAAVEKFRPEVQAEFKKYWRQVLRLLPARTRWRYRLETWTLTPGVAAARVGFWKLRSRRFHWKHTRRQLGRFYFYRSLPAVYRFHWAVGRLTEQFAAGLEHDMATEE
jgi:hypothetical protein